MEVATRASRFPTIAFFSAAPTTFSGNREGSYSVKNPLSDLFRVGGHGYDFASVANALSRTNYAREVLETALSDLRLQFQERSAFITLRKPATCWLIK